MPMLQRVRTGHASLFDKCDLYTTVITTTVPYPFYDTVDSTVQLQGRKTANLVVLVVRSQ